MMNIYLDINNDNSNLRNITNLIKNNLSNKYTITILNNNINNSEKIKETNKNNTLVLVFKISSNNQNEIIYPLNDNNELASILERNLDKYTDISKFYQLRLSNQTMKDYYEIIRETPLSETLILSFRSTDLQNNNVNISNAITESINDYLDKRNTYTVKSGDTLYSISKKFNVTVNDLKNINNLGNGPISIGQVLKIPEIINNSENINNNQNTYIVKKGDSLYSIAKNYNTTVDELKRLNNLNNNVLSIGQSLIIPNFNNNNNSSNNTYTVKSGDSLYSIARNFNTTVDELKRLNNLNSNLLSIGQILIMPNYSNNTYTVKSGDSLYSIARNFNTTVDELKRLNNLNSNLLSIGQILKIK